METWMARLCRKLAKVRRRHPFRVVFGGPGAWQFAARPGAWGSLRPMVREIAEWHGGCVGAESETGLGSTF